MEEAEIDFSDYLPKTTKDIDELWKTLGEFVASFQNPHLKALLEAFMSDPEIAARLQERSRRKDAAPCLHRRAARPRSLAYDAPAILICRNYPQQINRDLLLTGVFLHDIGKIHELSYARSFGYTDQRTTARPHDHRARDAAPR